MIRTIFNAFFTEIYSNKKEFVCLKFLESYRNNLFISIILCIYIFIFINFDIFSIPYIYSSIEIFFFIVFCISIFRKDIIERILRKTIKKGRNRWL